MSKKEDLRFAVYNYTEDDPEDFPTDIVHGGKINDNDAQGLDDESIMDTCVDTLHAAGYEFDSFEFWDHNRSH